ncbi:MAG: hypothetical protein R2778_16970 [Saprospiraceae bacterium]
MNDDFNIGEIVTPPAFQQLGIFVIDRWFHNGKTSEVSLSKRSREFSSKRNLNSFQSQPQKDCFSFSVVAFGDHAKMVAPDEGNGY